MPIICKQGDTELTDEDHLSRLRDHLEKRGGRRSMVDGWGARQEHRSEGRYAGTYDLYYYHPNGKRFRSMVEVARFFNLKDHRSRLPSTARLAKPNETPAASDAVNYALPPAVRACQFSIGTMLPGSDGKSRWQVAPRRDANGLVEWNCVDRAGFPLEQPKKRRLPAAPAPAPKRPAQDPSAGSFCAAPGADLVAWVCCDSCGKWRSVPHAPPAGTAAWYCSMHPDPNISRCDAPAEAMEEEEAEEVVYGVERLLGRRGAGRSVQYLVRWSGYDEGSDSWETAANICDPALVLAFEEDERRLGTPAALRAEGLTLVRSANASAHPNGTGYVGVQRVAGQRFACTARSGKFLGEFHSAEAAAHAYARDLGPTHPAAGASPARHAALVQRLEAHMAAHGLTQKAVASAVGVGGGRICLWLGKSSTKLSADLSAQTDSLIEAYLESADEGQAGVKEEADEEVLSVDGDDASTATHGDGGALHLAPSAPSADHAVLVQRLEAHMAAYGVTQRAVAAAVGVGEFRICRWKHRVEELSADLRAEMKSLIEAYLESGNEGQAGMEEEEEEEEDDDDEEEEEVLSVDGEVLSVQDGEAAAAVKAAVEALVAQLEREAAAAAAVRCAKEEGLTLVPVVGSKSGYHNVNVAPGSKSAPAPRYKAIARRRGKAEVLGTFSTAEEAALRVARHLGAAKSREVFESMQDHPTYDYPIHVRKPIVVTLHVAGDGAVQLKLRQRKPKPSGRYRNLAIEKAKRQIETCLDGATWLASDPSHSSGAAAGSEEDDSAPKRAASRRVASSTRAVDAALAVHGRLACPAYMAALHEQRGCALPVRRQPSDGPVCVRASLLPEGTPVRHQAAAPSVRVGPAHQASVVGAERLVPSWCGPSAGPPPRCGCGQPSTWTGRYAVCSTGGCSFLAEVPPDPLTPLCGCGLPCVWAHRRWWCSRWGAAGGDGCGFEGITHAAQASPTAISQRELSRAVAADTAAMLTASAFGISAWCFVAPSDCGLGLYARQVTPRAVHPLTPPYRCPVVALSPPSLAL